MKSTKKARKVAFVLGTRPEIIKLYPVIDEYRKKNYPFIVIHTNQHYDEKMDRVFFDDLDMPKPDYNLNIGSGAQGDQTGRMIVGIEKVLLKEKPDIVVVQGDTNTVLAGALVASKMGIKVAHVEAGLRSYDRTMPEEINRVLTDCVSNWLFCPTKLQKDILIDEGIAEEKIWVTGNTIVDAVKSVVKATKTKSDICERHNLKKEGYFLMTCHRPSNTDDKRILNNILSGIEQICTKENLKCVFPVHPRLKNKMKLIQKYQHIITYDPVSYPDLLKLQKNCQMVFTDSGGIQEESCILHKKCLILRLNTERPETVEIGGAVLLEKMSSNDILKKYAVLKEKKVKWTNPFGDGKAGRKIIQMINNG